MKHNFQRLAMAGAAIFSLAAGFAFAPHGILDNKVQVFKNTDGTFTYYNEGTVPSIHCNVITGLVSACTFSATATASVFNANNTSAPPTSDGVTVNYANTHSTYQ